MIRWLARHLIAEAYRAGYRDGWRARGTRQRRIEYADSWYASNPKIVYTQLDPDQARPEGRL